MENIQVCCRLRPLNSLESQGKSQNIWNLKDGNKTISLNPSFSDQILNTKTKGFNQRHPSFNFDNCFSEKCDNYEVYNRSIKKITLSSLKGINSTILMYGQTGSGKTYTMMGANNINSVENPLTNELIYQTLSNEILNSSGIMILALKDLFSKIEKVF